MKNTISNDNKSKAENPVTEGTADTVADNKQRKEKTGYPFPAEKDKQYKDQPEFIDQGSNSSKNE
ncbi:hypothetical protein BH10BAC2_BH10BAC2_37150 [soil metagenome]